jgi:iron complex outermembrane receptor protein
LTPWLSVSAGARLDRHNVYGTFVSPRLAVLVRRSAWTSRLSVGQGFFASTPLTEETEAAGLSRLQVLRPLRPERGGSASADLTRTVGPGTYTATLFASRVRDALAVERVGRYALFNHEQDSTNVGAELLATIRQGAFVATSTYTYVRSKEGAAAGREDAPLTPRHSAGLIGMWESDERGRIGVELYFTGQQRLEVNPYRNRSPRYAIVGLMAERRLGRLRVFINGENLTDVRQTRHDPLLRRAPSVDGRWTVDAWAPLDGRVINGGVRLAF